MRTFSVESDCLYRDINVESKHSNHLNESHLIAFQPSKFKGSLTKAFLLWLVLSFYATPLGAVMLSFVAIAQFLWSPFAYFKFWGIFGFVLLLFVFNLVVFYLWIYSSISWKGYDIVYSWFIPWFLIVLFMDSVIFSFQLNIRSRKLTKHVQSNWYLFGKCMKCQFFWYQPFWKHQQQDDNDPFMIIGSWGVTFHDYVPFGNITTYYPTPKTISINDYLATDCMTKYDVSKKWTICMGFKTYNKTEQIMCVIMAFLAFCYVMIPWIWHTIINSNDSSCKFGCWLSNISGLIEHGVASYCIFTYTELIYFQLFKYYAFMDQLADLLEINPIRKKKRMSSKQHIKSKQKRRQRIIKSTLIEDEKDAEKEMKKDVDSIKIEMDLLKKGSLTPLLKSNDIRKDDDNWSVIANDGDNVGGIRLSRIYLYLNENGQIWFENWCRIQSIAMIYFENRKYHIFAVILCITFGIVFVVIRILFSHTWFSPNIIAIYVGLLYFVVAFIRLLLSSVRFSDLQRKHIELLQNQHTFSLYKIKDEYIKYAQSDCNSFKKYLRNETIYKMNLQFIMDIITQIQFRSLSPKIAGVSLDSALLKLALSGLVFLLTSAITYELRQS